MNGLRTLTIRQPWASLIAAGVKTIETRSWSTKHRGRIGIHAGLTRPGLMWLPPLSRRRNDPADRQTWHVCDTITDPAFMGPRPQGSRTPKRAKTPTLFYPHEGPHGRPWDDKAGTSATEQGTAILLPLGVLVATAELVDVAPIGGPYSFRTGIVDGDEGDFPGQPVVVHHAALGSTPPSLVLSNADTTVTDITDQLPLGDFTPGRWAWLLHDIKPTTERCPACWGDGLRRAFTDSDQPSRWGGTTHPCPRCDGTGHCQPIPAKGKQGLWSWLPEAPR